MAIEEYLKQHTDSGMLRFLTCGSVDDGKSTLIGRILYDTQTVLDDQLAALREESRKYGTTRDGIDLALLVDGLQSEREQGITIDVAYRFFSTPKRKFIIADTPGHEQYTRNMVTGASSVDAAVILIDARKGISTQTKRHSYLVSLLGIKHVVVAVNKMDLVAYDPAVFDRIVRDYALLAETLKIPDTRYVPLSALEGENVVAKSRRMPWYTGETLLTLLETMEIERPGAPQPFRFPVQYVNRPHPDFRGFCGTILSGSVQMGDEVTVLPSGKKTRISKIIAAEDVTEACGAPERPGAFSPMAVTLVTEDEVDISRGDMIVHGDAQPAIADTVEAMIVWLDETPLDAGRSYDIRQTTSLFPGHVEAVRSKIDVHDFTEHAADAVGLNDIASCTIAFSRPVACDTYEQNRHTGSFIMIDRQSNRTAAAGMIVRAVTDGRSASPSYSDFEIELNRLIRTHFPHWGLAPLGPKEPA